MDEMQNWHEQYRELARVIGPGATKKLCAYFGGSQISFPKRLWDQQKEAVVIREEYQRGMSVVALARKHNYASRSIRRILARPQA
ncbi:Mor transcription activator family protein [Levilactobacillus cerevisiae]|uniref:Mor transcription activator family protein n=1 Tax=Levilactobacillus cerevisiae TaxID=1704076 RepID=UPI000F790906|nr:Mor transcription activator family protein [Levilactobacillus cerevisiae]